MMKKIGPLEINFKALALLTLFVGTLKTFWLIAPLALLLLILECWLPGIEAENEKDPIGYRLKMNIDNLKRAGVKASYRDGDSPIEMIFPKNINPGLAVFILSKLLIKTHSTVEETAEETKLTIP